MWRINRYLVKLAGASNDGSIVILCEAISAEEHDQWVTARVFEIGAKEWFWGNYFVDYNAAMEDWKERMYS